MEALATPVQCANSFPKETKLGWSSPYRAYDPPCCTSLALIVEFLTGFPKSKSDPEVIGKDEVASIHQVSSHHSWAAYH